MLRRRCAKYYQWGVALAALGVFHKMNGGEKSAPVACRLLTNSEQGVNSKSSSRIGADENLDVSKYLKKVWLPCFLLAE